MRRTSWRHGRPTAAANPARQEGPLGDSEKAADESEDAIFHLACLFVLIKKNSGTVGSINCPAGRQGAGAT